MACVVGAFLHITLLCHHCLFSYIQICFYLMNPCFTSSPCFDLLQNRCLAPFFSASHFLLALQPNKTNNHSLRNLNGSGTLLCLF